MTEAPQNQGRDADLDSRREVELLASLMGLPDAIHIVRQSIGAHQLSVPGVRAIYGAMIELAASGTMPTIVTLSTSLSRVIDSIYIDGHGGYEAIIYIDGMDKGRLATPGRYIDGILDAHRCRERRRVLHEVQSWLTSPPDSDAAMADLLAGVVDSLRGGTDATDSPSPIRASDLILRYPHMRQPIIEGMLRSGETMNLIASSKVGKSWLALGLALSLATGRDWLGHQCHAGKVLYIDNELHPETFAGRIRRVADDQGIGIDEYGGRIEVLPLRGCLRDLLSMGPFFASIQPGQYAAIILDAWYRFLPADADENSNGDVARLYNLVDHHAGRIGCAFVQIHHSSKGSQAGKSTTDVGAGAGSQSRATDAHIVLRPHEESGVYVMDAALRSWPPMESLALRWEWPRWSIDHEADPTRLAGGRGKASPEDKERKAAEREQAKEEKLRRAQEIDAEEAYLVLVELKRASNTQWREAIPCNQKQMTDSIRLMLNASRIERCQVSRPRGTGKSMVDGYRPMKAKKERSRIPVQKKESENGNT